MADPGRRETERDCSNTPKGIIVRRQPTDPDRRRPRHRSQPGHGSHHQPAGRRRPRSPPTTPLATGGEDVIDATGKIVSPGLIDMHVHLREPGREEDETIAHRHGRRRGRRLHLDRLHSQHRAADRHPGHGRVHPAPGRPGRPLQRVRRGLRQQESRGQGAGRDRPVGPGRRRGLQRRRRAGLRRRADAPRASNTA